MRERMLDGECSWEWMEQGGSRWARGGRERMECVRGWGAHLEWGSSVVHLGEGRVGEDGGCTWARVGCERMEER